MYYLCNMKDAVTTDKAQAHGNPVGVVNNGGGKRTIKIPDTLLRVVDQAASFI